MRTRGFDFEGEGWQEKCLAALRDGVSLTDVPLATVLELADYARRQGLDIVAEQTNGGFLVALKL